MRKLVTTAAIAVSAGAFLVLGAGAASAQGPGTCNFAPGASISVFAKFPGSNAGPNNETNRFNAPGTPESPGQAVKAFCVQ